MVNDFSTGNDVPQIQVTLIATINSGSAGEVTVDSGSTVGDLLDSALGLTNLQGYVTRVNGETEFSSYILKAGDRVTIAPMKQGGNK